MKTSMTTSPTIQGRMTAKMTEEDAKSKLFMGIDWGMGPDQTVVVEVPEGGAPPILHDFDYTSLELRVAAALGVPEVLLKPKKEVLDDFNEKLTDAIYKMKMEHRFRRQFTPVEQVPPQCVAKEELKDEPKD